MASTTSPPIPRALRAQLVLPSLAPNFRLDTSSPLWSFPMMAPSRMMTWNNYKCRPYLVLPLAPLFFLLRQLVWIVFPLFSITASGAVMFFFLYFPMFPLGNMTMLFCVCRIFPFGRACHLSLAPLSAFIPRYLLLTRFVLRFMWRSR